MNLNDPVTRETPNFRWHEFACKCQGQHCSGFPDEDGGMTWRIALRLQRLRSLLKYIYGVEYAIKVNSGARCEEHNKSVGGAAGSQHLDANAADIVASNKVTTEIVQTVVLANFALAVGFTGVKVYQTHVHVDLRSSERFTRGFNPQI